MRNGARDQLIDNPIWNLGLYYNWKVFDSIVRSIPIYITGEILLIHFMTSIELSINLLYLIYFSTFKKFAY